MDQPPSLESLSKEDRIKLALQAIENLKSYACDALLLSTTCQEQPSKGDALGDRQHAIPTLNHQTLAWQKKGC
jgi:hypothetical protein